MYINAADDFADNKIGIIATVHNVSLKLIETFNQKNMSELLPI